MASLDNLPPDPLSLLRSSIAANTLPIPTTSDDPSSQAQSDVSLAQASYLIFNSQSPQNGAQHIAIPLTQPTRFISAALGKGIDLRSVYFAWLNREKTTAQYITASQELNNELNQAGKDETATNVVFTEKLDLVTWLSGDIPENGSEYIQSLDDNKANRIELDDTLKTIRDDVEMRDAGGAPEDGTARRAGAKEEEAQRLRKIYASERRMADHNTVLRGTKWQDFSGARKYSALFLGKAGKPAQAQPPVPSAAVAPPTITLTSNPALRPSSNKPRRPEPIILLSPSASSLLRMGNIKAFLEDGQYAPLAPGTENPSMLAISRTLRSIQPDRPLRFLLTDDTASFRPDYWTRVVAVFTTGQTWQFKNYRWQNPAELFSHALGVYIGWTGENVPDTVKGWGRQVLSVQIDKGSQRWRDREVVETVWSHVETRMRAMGWGKDGR